MQGRFVKMAPFYARANYILWYARAYARAHTVLGCSSIDASMGVKRYYGWSFIDASFEPNRRVDEISAKDSSPWLDKDALKEMNVDILH